MPTLSPASGVRFFDRIFRAMLSNVARKPWMPPGFGCSVTYDFGPVEATFGEASRLPRRVTASAETRAMRASSSDAPRRSKWLPLLGVPERDRDPLHEPVPVGRAAVHARLLARRGLGPQRITDRREPPRLEHRAHVAHELGHRDPARVDRAEEEHQDVAPALEHARAGRALRDLARHRVAEEHQRPR